MSLLAHLPLNISPLLPLQRLSQFLPLHCRSLVPIEEKLGWVIIQDHFFWLPVELGLLLNKAGLRGSREEIVIAGAKLGIVPVNQARIPRMVHSLAVNRQQKLPFIKAPIIYRLYHHLLCLIQVRQPHRLLGLVLYVEKSLRHLTIRIKTVTLYFKIAHGKTAGKTRH